MKIIHFHHHFHHMDICMQEKNQNSWTVGSPCDSRPKTDVSTINGGVPVNILRPGVCKPFGDYTSNVFVPHIKREQSKVQRVDIHDIIWDQQSGVGYYRLQYRKRRRAGVTQPQTKRLSSHEQQQDRIVQLLDDDLTLMNPLIVTDGANVFCIPTQDALSIAPYNHEEALPGSWYMLIPLPSPLPSLLEIGPKLAKKLSELDPMCRDCLLCVHSFFLQ